MLISWRYKFLFVHIPKTGGTSLHRMLYPYARARDKYASAVLRTPVMRRAIAALARGKEPMEFLSGLNAHATLSAAEKVMGNETLDPLRVITFARNPYARAYSLYLHMRRVPTHWLHAQAKEASFSEVLRHHLLGKWDRQHAFLRSKSSGVLRADFVGRFERYEEDVARLSAYLDLPRPISPLRLNVTPEQKPDLRAAFGDAQAEFVDAMAADFEYFGYSTDIDRALEPPMRDIEYAP